MTPYVWNIVLRSTPAVFTGLQSTLKIGARGSEAVVAGGRSASWKLQRKIDDADYVLDGTGLKRLLTRYAWNTPSSRPNMTVSPRERKLLTRREVKNRCKMIWLRWKNVTKSWKAC